MKFTKRDFLKIAGLTTVGITAGPAVKIFGADVEVVKPNPNALTGHRWAMTVDMKKCKSAEGCTGCSDTCHSVHNVPDWRDPKDPTKPWAKHEIKWIWTDSFDHVFPEKEHHYNKKGLAHKPFITLCNQCDNPPCVRVCPTQATWKRKSDGIIMMDMHRCIGCRFCMAACPYGSRSFNYLDPRRALKKPYNPNFPTRMKGVVEKCNFCAERLAIGKIPACVEKCKQLGHNALAFGDLEDHGSEVYTILQDNFTIRRKPEIGTAPQVYYIV